MKHASRRTFMQKSALVALGVAVAGPEIASGRTEAEIVLHKMDRDLARVLQSYGRATAVETGGYQDARVDGKTRRLKMVRFEVEVQDQESFRRSFQTLADFNERVWVDGNKVGITGGDRYIVLDNKVV